MNAVQAAFLEMLPQIETHARIVFRHIRCPEERADRIAETVAMSWQWFCRLHDRGKDAREFQAGFATLAARASGSGRKLAGMVKAKDAMNDQKQRYELSLSDNPFSEALVDNSQSTPADQAAFRIDFACWYRSLPERDRRLVEDMGLGFGTMELAERYGLSPGRISQKREQFRTELER